jgi:hypothetical protein
MKDRYFKYISLLIVFLVIESCSTFKINSAGKNLVIPGFSKSKKYMLYKVEFESKQNFSIDKVELGNNQITKFSLYNINTKLYEDAGSTNIKKGVYRLSFKLFNFEPDTNNTVTLYIKQGNKTKTISSELKTTDTVHRK